MTDQKPADVTGTAPKDNKSGQDVTEKPAAGPPREYEILIDQHGQPFEMRRIEDEAFANCTYSFDRKIVHVIEKSAYDQLAQELERRPHDIAYCEAKYDELKRERDQLRKERDEAAEIIDVWKSRSEINGKLAIKLQDERDKEVRQADVLAIALATYRNHEFCECGVEGCNDCAEDCGVRAYVDGELLAYRAFRGSK